MNIKNPFEVLSPHLKIMDKFERGVGRDIFLDIQCKHLLSNLSIPSFRWRLITSNKFLRIKDSIIPHFF